MLADVTEHFDVTEPSVGTSETPLWMSTGSFAIAFDVSGRLRVDAREGAWLRPVGPPRPHLLTRAVSAASVALGQSAMVVGVGGRSHVVTVSPDGAVYHQAFGGDHPDSGDDGLTDLGGRFEAPLTVVAADPDQVSLFGLSPDGAVLHKVHAPGGSPDGEWRTLGGSFAGPVAAAAGADGAVELFARDEDGSVSHRTLDDPLRGHAEEEWERVGAGAGGALTALFSPRTGLSLFALGRDGEVLHKRRPPQEDWEPQGREWETLGVASDGTLSAEWVGDGVLLLAVVAPDETVRVLAWPRYPHEPSRGGWQAIGTVNSLLRAQVPRGEAAATDAPKGA